MLNDRRPEIGSTVVIQKPEFDKLLANLRKQGYQTIGPRVQDGTLVYGPVEGLEELPKGYVSEQEAGHFRLIDTGHARYFEVIPGAQSWKQFLFPPRVELFKLQKDDGTWKTEATEQEIPHYAFIGVRGCELAAIQIQDTAFLRSDFNDPIYRARREHVFILAANCLHPAGTCFCASMGTGPRVKAGFDLNLTELDEVFLLTIGSELGRGVLDGIKLESASAFLLSAADRGIEQANQQMGREMDTDELPELMLGNLDHPYWQEVGKRCLSCANCTQVCPTCFCWDAVDSMDLTGSTTKRERVWDSCFNPGFSIMAGGNTRPNIPSRYRQWMTHKLGSWKQQYGTLGCVGCGRCITWCPVGIDITAGVAEMRKEKQR